LKSFILARSPIPTLDKDQPLSNAVEIMEYERLSALPVLDDGRFVGIVTIRDILSRIWGERVRMISLSSLYVSSVMKTDIPTVSLDSSLFEASELMIKHGLIAIPIINDGKPVGMIFEEDFPKLFLNSNADSSGFIIRNPRIVDIDSSLLNVRLLMLKENLRFIPVVKGERFVGVVRDFDIITVLKFIQDKVSSQHRVSRVKSLRASDVMRSTKAYFYGYPPISVVAKSILDERGLGAVALNEDNSVLGIVNTRIFVKMLLSWGFV